MKTGLASCPLIEVDLKDDWVKLQVPKNIMENGFNAGDVLVDFSWVQLATESNKLIAVTEESHKEAGATIATLTAERDKLSGDSILINDSVSRIAEKVDILFRAVGCRAIEPRSAAGDAILDIAGHIKELQELLQE